MIVWFYSLVSIAIISFISLIGLVTFMLNEKHMKRILLYLVSFSAGGLFSGAFFHLIPETIEETGYEIHIPILILFGISFSFTLEKILQWRHCHIITSEEHPHSFAYMNLFGDGIHNFVDLSTYLERHVL